MMFSDMIEHPWFKFYAGEFQIDPKVSNLPPESEGLLVRMWCLCNREGSCPSDPELLARKTLRPLVYVSRWLPHCLQFFESREGRLVSPRMEAEKRKSETNRKNANQRWSKTQKEPKTQISECRNANRIANLDFCNACGGTGRLHQSPDVPGPRLIACPECQVKVC